MVTLPTAPGRSPNEPTTEGGAGEPKSRTDKPTAGSGAKRRPCGRAQASTQGADKPTEGEERERAREWPRAGALPSGASQRIYKCIGRSQSVSYSFTTVNLLRCY